MSQGLLLSNYSGCAHPSQPNYICMAAAKTYGITDDSVHNLTDTTIVDLLDGGGISWKLYQENYPTNADGSCFTGDAYPYLRKHNPLMSFTNVQSNITRCANIQNETQFQSDINSNSLSQYSFYTPNMQNDGHDTNLTFAGSYLSTFMSTYYALFPKRTLVYVTFDEADPSTSPDYNPNHILTFLLGDMITPSTLDTGLYTHASLVRLIEMNWNLTDLGHMDTNSAIMFPLLNNLYQNATIVSTSTSATTSTTSSSTGTTSSSTGTTSSSTGTTSSNTGTSSSSTGSSSSSSKGTTSSQSTTGTTSFGNGVISLINWKFLVLCLGLFGYNFLF